MDQQPVGAAPDTDSVLEGLRVEPGVSRADDSAADLGFRLSSLIEFVSLVSAARGYADLLRVMAAESRKALKEIQDATAAARKMMESSEFANLPKDLKTTLAALEKSVASVGPEGAIQGDLLRTLDELRSALRSMNAMATSIDEKPNSIIFGRDSSGNPIPKAPKATR